MVDDRFSTQFFTCAKEIISYRSEWNEDSQLSSRLSEYLHFLRGRGATLLESYLTSNESTTNDDFHRLLLRTLACLAPLSTVSKNCPRGLVSFVPTAELVLPQRISSSATKKKTHSRSNSNHGVVNNKQQQRVHHPAHHHHRHDFRVFTAHFANEQHDDFSDVFTLILKIVAQAASYKSLIDLQCVTDAINRQALTHKIGNVTANLIALVSVHVKSLRPVGLTAENDPNVQIVSSLTSSARLLILDGQEESALQLIEIVAQLQRLFRCDSPFAMVWNYTSTIQMVNLLHLSNFSNLLAFEHVITLLQGSEQSLRRQINETMMMNQSNISTHHLMIQSAVNHANAIEAEDLATNHHEKSRTDSVCLFGRFTRSVYYLLRLVPKELLPLIKTAVSSSLCCCCLSIDHILTTVPFGSFDILPKLLKRCDYHDCPRCVRQDQSRQWMRLESFRSYQAEHNGYSQIIVQLAEVLPGAGIRVLLDQLIVPLIKHELIEKTLASHLDPATPAAVILERYSIAARRCIGSMGIAPLGLFGQLFHLLRRITRPTVATGYAHQIIPICVHSLQLIAVNEQDRNEKRQLAMFFVRLFLDEINCVENRDTTWIANGTNIRLRLESKFIIEQFYKCCVCSSVFRSTALETDGIRDVFQSLLDKSLRLVGDPKELSTDYHTDYLSVDVSVRLNTRVELFALILGLYTYSLTTSTSAHSEKQLEMSTLPDLGLSVVKQLRKCSDEPGDWMQVWIRLMKCALKPDTAIPSIHHRNNFTSPHAQPNEAASGYEASSEDERLINRQRPNVTPVILHGKLMKFVFVSYAEFAATTDQTTKIECLIAMLKYLIDLFNNEINVAKCAAANVVKVILEENSSVLDNRDNERASNYLLQLFSASSKFKVSPAALKIILNKLTNPMAPIQTITQCLLDLFDNTSQMVSHIIIPARDMDPQSPHVEVVPSEYSGSTSVWCRALLHYKVNGAAHRKHEFDWSVVFWLRGAITEDGDDDDDVEKASEEVIESSTESDSDSSTSPVVLHSTQSVSISTVHMVTIGGESGYLVQLWTEGERFIVQIVEDVRDAGLAPATLARDEFDELLSIKPGKWSLVQFHVEEMQAALKNHLSCRLTLNISCQTTGAIASDQLIIEFPQLGKKSTLRSTSIDWFFGDGNSSKAQTNQFHISACSLFRTSLSNDDLIALRLLGPDSQDLSSTLNDNLLSPFHPELSDLQYRYLLSLIANTNTTGDQLGSKVARFKPNLNALRNKRVMWWLASTARKISLANLIPKKTGLFSKDNHNTDTDNPFVHMGQMRAVNQLQGAIKVSRSAGLVAALYKLGGVRPFLISYANSLQFKESKLQSKSIYILLSAAQVDLTFAIDFNRLNGHQLVKQVLMSGDCSPMILSQVVSFCCRGKILDDDYQLLFHNDAVIVDLPILKTLLLDSSIWSRCAESWLIQLKVINSLVQETNRFRAYNLRILIEAEAVLRLLESLQITLHDNNQLLLPGAISDQLIEVIRALIGYPPDTKIISRVFDFCCAVHPAAQAYATNIQQKFYFYPQFQRAKSAKSMQLKVERSHSLDIFESGTFMNSGITAPRRIRSQSENIGAYHIQTTKPSRLTNLMPRELFGPESLSDTPHGTPTEERESFNHDDQCTQEPSLVRSSEAERVVETVEPKSSDLNEWEVLRRTESTSSGVNKDEQAPSTDTSLQYEDANPGKTSLVVGFLEVLRHALVLLPDSDLSVVLTEEVLDWKCLVVLCNNRNDQIRYAVLKLLQTYLERAGQSSKSNLVKQRGFLLLANQLYQYPTTLKLVEAAVALTAGRAEPLMDVVATSAGVSIKDIDVSVLPACAPLLAIIEGALYDEMLSDDLCWTIKELFESNAEMGDTMLDRGLSIVLTNVVARQTQQGLAITEGTVALLHAVVTKCCTTNVEHFTVVKDILDALSSQEMKMHELDDSEVCDQEIETDSHPVVCIECAKIVELRKILFSVYWVSIESLLNATDLALANDGDSFDSGTARVKQSNSMIMLNATTSTPRKVAKSNSSTGTGFTSNGSVSGGVKSKEQKPFKIPEAELTQRLSLIIRGAIKRIECQGASRCHLHANDLGDELGAKHSQLSAHSALSGSMSGNGGQGDQADVDAMFAAQLFSLIVKWMAEAAHSTLNVGRTSKMRLAQRLALPLAPDLARLITFMLSPPGGRSRLVPLSLVKEQNKKHVLFYIYNGSHAEAAQSQLYLAYIRGYHANNLSCEERQNADELSQLISEMGFESPDLSAGHNADLDKRRYELKLSQESRAWIHTTRHQFRQIVERANRYSERVAKSAADITQAVVTRQNGLRKRLNERIKSVAAVDVASRDTWRHLVAQLSHTRAVWYSALREPPCVWQLNPTEGPQRERRRLERARRRIHRKFFRNQHNNDDTNNDDDVGTAAPLAQFLREDPAEDAAAVVEWLHTHHTIYVTESCRRITPEHESQGDFLISSEKLYFVSQTPLDQCFISRGTLSDAGFCRNWQLDQIKQVQPRWFGLRDCALELFFIDGAAEMFAFQSAAKRDSIVKLVNKTINHSNAQQQSQSANNVNLDELQLKWRRGEITNFAYLMELNKAAGRTFNDLMQYPVFPFILSDYSSTKLDLKNPAIFRDLTRPISVQSDVKKQLFEERYFFLKEERERNPESTDPYHYGSHYSNSGTVLHFLLRLPPFTQMFLDYQDNQFDLPDRTFHSMETAYRLASHDSATDVKELIPEFFFLPEFLVNNENFNFGERQNGKLVHHVTLPPWSGNDSRLFVFIHRQALESAQVSAHLHHWIDLVFGFKQRGVEAIKAVNVFHPLTYFGVDIDAEQDPVKRQALETMIKTYGQTPRQLFTQPHPAKLKSTLSSESDQESISSLNNEWSICPNVTGLKWGTWCASPALQEPRLILRKTFKPGNAVSVYSFGKSDCAVLPMGNKLIRNTLITYDHDDRILRLKNGKKRLNLFKPAVEDRITTCEPIDNYNLVIGFESGLIKTFSLHSYTENPKMSNETTLIGHDRRINSIAICVTFSIIATASDDCSCIIWDLNSKSYCRTLYGHPSSVSNTSISKQTGEIVTICALNEQERQSQLHRGSQSF